MCRQRPGQTADLRPAVGPPVLPELQLQVSGSGRRVWRTEEGKRARSSTGESSETRICTQPYMSPRGNGVAFLLISWQASCSSLVMNLDFYLPTVLKVHPPISGITAHAIMLVRLAWGWDSLKGNLTIKLFVLVTPVWFVEFILTNSTDFHKPDKEFCLNLQTHYRYNTFLNPNPSLPRDFFGQAHVCFLVYLEIIVMR